MPAAFLNADKLSIRLADSTLEYEPLLLARHASRLAELVDKCLALRKDIRELEVLSVKSLTDYELFESTSGLDEQLEVLRLQTNSKNVEASGFEKAIAIFGDTSVEKGLTEISRGKQLGLQADVDDCTKMEKLITQRWANLRQYQEAYHARYTEPGNAHNFGQRAELLLRVLIVQMHEAVARAAAISSGVHVIYGQALEEFPHELTMQSLDDFALWALRALRELGRAADDEESAEIVLPLVQPWFGPNGSLIDMQTFKDAISGAKGKPISLPFEIRDDGMLDARTRIRAISLSFGNEYNPSSSGIDRNQTTDAFSRMFVKITTPEQIAEDGTSYRRSPVVLGNVCLHAAGSPLATADGATVENLRPFGKWTVDVHPLAVWKDSSIKTVSANRDDEAKMLEVRDFKLTLRTYVPGKIVPLPKLLQSQ
ncbi:hypothetical protein CI15_23570 [Paraburkholderia monticola]|uniref:Uncharacterized protein n=2 Tax=Paraburkholderia monticola TaxID=1399968 RepID=A0A149PHU3_9BURK|nr:hypothetical protein CI15_23570 [Paraburkholderia monticola]